MGVREALVAQDDAVTTFEDAFAALRRTVEELEAGALSLDVAISRYEEGMRLVRICNDLLDGAELRIQRVGQELNTERPRSE